MESKNLVTFLFGVLSLVLVLFIAGGWWLLVPLGVSVAGLWYGARLEMDSDSFLQRLLWLFGNLLLVVSFAGAFVGVLFEMIGLGWPSNV